MTLIWAHWCEEDIGKANNRIYLYTKLNGFFKIQKARKTTRDE
jgi:hypothetical protein